MEASPSKLLGTSGDPPERGNCSDREDGVEPHRLEQGDRKGRFFGHCSALVVEKELGQTPSVQDLSRPLQQQQQQNQEGEGDEEGKEGEEEERSKSEDTQASPRCLCSIPPLSAYSLENLWEKGCRYQVIALCALSFVALLAGAVSPIIFITDSENLSGSERQLAMSVGVFSLFGIPIGISEWFLPMFAYEGWKIGARLLGGFGGGAFAILNFYLTPLGTRSLMETYACVAVITGAQTVSMAHIRGLEQHIVNEKRWRREAAENHEEKMGRAQVDSAARGCTENLIRLVSPKLAKTPLHCAVLWWVKIMSSFLDVSSDIAGGFLYLNSPTTLTREVQIGLASVLLVFGIVDFFVFTFIYVCNNHSSTDSVLIHGVGLVCEIVILVMMAILTAGAWEKLHENSLDLGLAWVNLGTTFFGILLACVALYVNLKTTSVRHVWVTSTKRVTGLARSVRSMTVTLGLSPTASPALKGTLRQDKSGFSGREDMDKERDDSHPASGPSWSSGSLQGEVAMKALLETGETQPAGASEAARGAVSLSGILEEAPERGVHDCSRLTVQQRARIFQSRSDSKTEERRLRVSSGRNMAEEDVDPRFQNDATPKPHHASTPFIIP